MDEENRFSLTQDQIAALSGGSVPINYGSSERSKPINPEA